MCNKGTSPEAREQRTGGNFSMDLTFVELFCTQPSTSVLGKHSKIHPMSIQPSGYDKLLVQIVNSSAKHHYHNTKPNFQLANNSVAVHDLLSSVTLIFLSSVFQRGQPRRSKQDFLILLIS